MKAFGVQFYKSGNIYFASRFNFSWFMPLTLLFLYLELVYFVTAFVPSETAPGGEGLLHIVGPPPQPEECGRRRRRADPAEPEQGGQAPGLVERDVNL